MTRLIFRLFLLFGFLGSSGLRAEPPAPLPALHGDPAAVSVSGLSSGGFMAVQYSVAHSARIMGAGIVAGGPYGCASFTPTPVLLCLTGPVSGSASWKSAVTFSANDIIDPVEKLKSQRIYLFSGTKDGVVNPKVMAALAEFYKAAKVPAANMLYVNTVPAGHAFIAAGFGNGCGENEAPFVDQCNVGGKPYDQPGEILTHIYGPLAAKATSLSSAPVPFDQNGFGAADAAMAGTGYVYVPAPCQAAAMHCRVHVVFHGCVQSASKVGDDVYADVGYNGWADSNNIIVLYPQVDASLANPQGCWDWFGYNGGFPQLRSSAQIKVIDAMVSRLLE